MGGKAMASILYVATDEGVVTLTSEDGHNWKQEHHGLKDWQIPVLRTCSRAAFTDIPSTGERNRLHGPI